MADTIPGPSPVMIVPQPATILDVIRLLYGREGMEYVVSRGSDDQSTYDSLVVLNGEKPSFDEIMARTAEAQALLDTERLANAKADAFLGKYGLQEQIIIVGRAVLLGDMAELKTMLDYLDAL